MNVRTLRPSLNVKQKNKDEREKVKTENDNSRVGLAAIADDAPPTIVCLT